MISFNPNNLNKIIVQNRLIIVANGILDISDSSVRQLNARAVLLRVIVHFTDDHRLSGNETNELTPWLVLFSEHSRASYN